mmetsp:Transcript_72631/g.219877  ORF Transcript_72631/g.219877 Transcript_72631/m.219877 type:complete len:88 (-) Transcript_72631:10-273(-)
MLPSNAPNDFSTPATLFWSSSVAWRAATADMPAARSTARVTMPSERSKTVICAPFHELAHFADRFADRGLEAELHVLGAHAHVAHHL